jgi:hypothetical protein
LRWEREETRGEGGGGCSIDSEEAQKGKAVRRELEKVLNGVVPIG